MSAISAVAFDKDGTLFDFHASWGGWTSALVRELVGDDRARAARLVSLLGYDARSGRFAPDSPVISETPDVLARLMLPHLPSFTAEALTHRMNLLAVAAPMVEAVPLAPLLAGLRERGLRLGVTTNDAEAPARAHLQASGVAASFDFIAGFDSGHGAKPHPGMLLAFAQSCGLPPERVAIVGDSRHDLIAGRAAGMTTIAVLTGPVAESELAPLADAVLPDIGHLPALLDEGGPARACG
jgi:phosphoglycolate phosphatase